MGEINGIVDDVELFAQCRADVERGIGDHQRFGIHRHIETENMRHAPPCSEGGARQHRMQQFIGMQTALHQQLDLACSRHIGGLVGGGMAVGNIDQLEFGNVQSGISGGLFDFGLGPHQDRNDQAMAEGIDGALQRFRIARMDDRTTHRFQSRAFGQEGFEARFGIKQLDMRGIAARASDLLCGRQNTGRAMQHAFGMLVVDLAIEIDFLLRLVLAQYGGLDRQRIADPHGAREMQLLMQIDGAGPGKMGAQQSRNHRCRPHAMGNHPVEYRIIGIVGVEMGRIGVARHRCKGLDIGNGQHARHHI